MEEEEQGMRAFVSRTLVTLATAMLVLSVSGMAQDKSPKLAIINIQQAIAQCTDGQEAAKTLRDKFAPRRADLEKQQKDIADLQNQLKTQDKTLSDDARNKLMRSLDDKTRLFNRANEDATQEFQAAEQDAINEIGRKMLDVINEHAKKNGYALIVDVSSPQTPVLYADATLEITTQVIEAYNQAHKSAAPAETKSTPAVSPKPAAK
jgi:outer membrane protein